MTRPGFRHAWRVLQYLTRIWERHLAGEESPQTLPPDLELCLFDIGPGRGGPLRRRTMTALARLALWCIKNAWTPERLVRDLPTWAPLFEEAAAGPRGREALEPILVYIWRVSDRPTGQRFARRLASEVNEAMEKEFVSAADELQQEAVSRVLVRQLEARFGPLPDEARQRIEAASTEQIEQWALRVIDASSLDDVLASD